MLKFWMVLGLAACGAAPACGQTAGLLGNVGVTLGVTDSENLLGNVSGGVKQGATLQGVATGTLQIDTAKAFGLAGGTVHVTALQIHGAVLSPGYLADLQAANGNEAEDTTRLWEAWYDQAFGTSGVDVKLGQQSIDNEFIVSQYSGLFVNTMAGWPLVPSADLYGGGPAYPLASLGARVQVKPNGSETFLAGVFDDNPGGGAFSADAQALDRQGTRFNVNTGALVIAEGQQAVSPGGLAGVYKLGFWVDSGVFPDQRYGTDGLPLASPSSDGVALMHKGNFSIYVTADQTVWQSAADSARNVNLFGRLMGAPPDQNLVSLSFNGGVTMASPLPGRDNDQAGLDFGLAQVSSRAAAADRDAGRPAQGSEEIFEITYQAQITPWLSVQPDVQYVVNPAGGVQDPADPAHMLHNEVVAGARAVVSF